MGGLPGMILTSADVLDHVAKEIEKASGAPEPEERRDKTAGRDNGRSGNQRKRNGSLVAGDDGSMPDLEIVGPTGTKTFLHSLRHFMRRDRFHVRTHEGKYASSLDKNATSQNTRRKAKRKKKGGDYDGGKKDEVNFDIESIPIEYDCESVSSHVAPRRTHAMSFVFSTAPIPGKFLVDKAKELNVPRGPMYAQLKSGKSVTFIDADTNTEKTVTTEQVVAASSPGIGVAVVYCPSLTVLNGLKLSETLSSFQGGASTDDKKPLVELEVMVHFTPKSIFDTPEYRAWCDSFGSGVDHLTLHSAESLETRVSLDVDSPFLSGISGGIRRSFVNEKLFPSPILKQYSDDSRKGDGSKLSIIEGRPLLDYVLMPKSRRGLNESSLKDIYSPALKDDLHKEAMDSGAVEQASTIMSSGTMSSGTDESSTNLGELIFTGTGSAVPCKHRNVTGKYLRMNNGNSMLLDVGEGTVGQLLRSWKSTLPGDVNAIHEYRSRLEGIKAVWISHPHADHHLGILRLLAERSAICNSPLILMAPRDLFDFLNEYHEPEIRRSFLAVDCFDMLHDGRCGNPMAGKLYDLLGITSCVSIPVAHCKRSFAVVIDGTSFGRLSYSGDCRPSNRFAGVGNGTDLLIHEATFENGMEEDAVLKRHSTVGEAIRISSKMNAKALVLTHFSQRYPKIPLLEDEDHHEKRIPVVVAFDFMRLTPDSLQLASQLVPALRLLYPPSKSNSDDQDEAGKATAKQLMSVPGAFAVRGVL